MIWTHAGKINGEKTALVSREASTEVPWAIPPLAA